jgi:hypothetical protein
MAYNYDGKGEDYTRDDGSTFHVPKDTDVADAPLAFEQFAESIPFSEYVNVDEVTTGTRTVEEKDNGKMLFVKVDSELTFGDLSQGFTVAVVGDTNVTVTFSGTNNDKGVGEYKVATVVRVNDTNILSVAGEGSGADCPDCQECPEPDPTPPAAVISGATGAVLKYSFEDEDSGQNYDVYEFTGAGELVVADDGAGMVDALVVGGGGSGSSGNGPSGGGGGAGSYLLLENNYLDGNATVVIGAGGATSSVNATGDVGGFSRLGSLYGIGGGGGSARSSVGPNGASGGGGAGSDDAIGRTGGAGIDGLGKPGGTAGSSASAGGGGASQAGEDAPGTTAGKGGDGINASVFTGQVTEMWVCGGGGGAAASVGGAGGSGVGGKGGVTGGTAGEGDPNTGSGGGGGYLNGAAKGGSGIVLVRCKVSSPSFGLKTRSAVRTAHAARIEDGIVRQVIVIPHLDDDDAKITEYCNSIGLEGIWMDTSYTGSRRGKYAGVGDKFNMTRSGGEFVSPESETAPEQDTMIIDGKEQQVKRRRRK